MKKKVFKSFKLPVSFLREGKFYIAYTPALDLSTFGKTLEEAKERFVEAVEIFFDEASKMGTLEEILLNLGWVKRKKEIIPPVVISHNLESIKVPVYK